MKLLQHHLKSLLSVKPLERVYSGRRIGSHEHHVLVRQLLPGLPPDEYVETASLFERHMTALASLVDPATFPVREFAFDDDGLFYFVTDVPVGMTLTEFIGKTGSLPVPTAAAIGARIGECFIHAHSRGITHLGLNSDLVLLASGHQISVLDMGMIPLLLERVEGRLRDVSVAWSALFPHAGLVAPELIAQEDAGPLTDVYVLGALLYFMSTSVSPYTGSSVVAYNSIVAGNTRPDPRYLVDSIAPAYADLVGRCLRRRPADRPSSMEVVVEELRELALPMEEALGPYQAVIEPVNYLERFNPLLTLVDDQPAEYHDVEPPPSPAVIPLFSNLQIESDEQLLEHMTPEQRLIYKHQLLRHEKPQSVRTGLVVGLLIGLIALVYFVPSLFNLSAPIQHSSTVVTADQMAPLERRQAESDEVQRSRKSIVLYIK